METVIKPYFYLPYVTATISTAKNVIIWTTFISSKSNFRLLIQQYIHTRKFTQNNLTVKWIVRCWWHNIIIFVEIKNETFLTFFFFIFQHYHTVTYIKDNWRKQYNFLNVITLSDVNSLLEQSKHVPSVSTITAHTLYFTI